MKKKPTGVFSLIVTAFTGFGAHLLALCATGRDRLLALQSRKARPGKRWRPHELAVHGLHRRRFHPARG